jgi:hypothetical protein
VTGRRRVLHDAALSYVDAGWPFVPGVTASGLGCSCGRLDCRSPAAHPRDENWQGAVITDPAPVRLWCAADSAVAPNIVLACGTAFDVWSVPHTVGTGTLHALFPAGLTRSVPVAVTPTDRMHLFTAPASPQEVAQILPGLDVQHRGAGEFVPAPPSTRGAHGDDMWLIRPGDRLMPCEPVVATLVRVAEGHRHRPRGHRRTGG